MPHAGHDVAAPISATNSSFISIHMPHAGHDSSFPLCSSVKRISIHMPHAGHDFIFSFGLFSFPYFNPHAPCGAWLENGPVYVTKQGDFNPHAPCGAWRTYRWTLRRSDEISIHMPHAGHDPNGDGRWVTRHISIHMPHAGHDVLYFWKTFITGQFQSTCPMRGMTVVASCEISGG